MNKLGIWGLVIAVAFVIGVLSANPVVEAVGGWKAAVADLQNQIDDIEPSVQVYEVSAVSVIPAGERLGNEVQLRCLDGDRFLNDVPILTVTIPPGLFEDTADISFGSSAREIREIKPLIDGDRLIIIGIDTAARADGIPPPFDVPVTVTGLCLSPSS